MKVSDITTKKWREAENLLEGIGQIQAATYTVVLVNKNRPFGTCVLLHHRGKNYLLTAAHVALEIGKKGFEEIGVAIKPDEISRTIPLHRSDLFCCKFWDRNFKVSDLQNDPYTCKDLALIEIPLILESAIKSTKGFARLSESTVDSLDLNACYVGYGVLENNGLIQMTSLGLSLCEKRERDGREYYIARAMKETFGAKVLKEPALTNFQGYSGGGLFLVKDKSVSLVGIAYYQDREHLAEEEGYVEIFFYGTASLKASLKEICAAEEASQ